MVNPEVAAQTAAIEGLLEAGGQRHRVAFSKPYSDPYHALQVIKMSIDGKPSVNVYADPDAGVDAIADAMNAAIVAQCGAGSKVSMGKFMGDFFVAEVTKAQPSSIELLASAPDHVAQMMAMGFEMCKKCNAPMEERSACEHEAYPE